MERLKGWWIRKEQSKQHDTPPATPVLDLNASDVSPLPSAAAGDAAVATQAAAAAAGAAAAANAADSQAAAADSQAAAASTSSSSEASSSSSSSSIPAGAEPSTSNTEQQQQQDAEDDGNINPMLQTALTKRFRGKFEPLAMPTYETMMQEDFMNNCAVRSTIAGGMGGLLGVAFGVFTASLDTQGIDAAPLGETKPTRVVLRETWQLMKEKSRSYAKGFAGMGFLYSGTECMIERYRAKHDAMNATLAGCATGGLMAAPGGAKAMCFGCASFAAFSTAIEYFTGGM